MSCVDLELDSRSERQGRAVAPDTPKQRAKDKVHEPGNFPFLSTLGLPVHRTDLGSQ